MSGYSPISLGVRPNLRPWPIIWALPLFLLQYWCGTLLKHVPPLLRSDRGSNCGVKQFAAHFPSKRKSVFSHSNTASIALAALFHYQKNSRLHSFPIPGRILHFGDRNAMQEVTRPPRLPPLSSLHPIIVKRIKIARPQCLLYPIRSIPRPSPWLVGRMWLVMGLV